MLVLTLSYLLVYDHRLVSFGELTEPDLIDTYLGTVESIEEDQLNSGGFIVGTSSSLLVIFPNRSSKIIAGISFSGCL